MYMEFHYILMGLLRLHWFKQIFSKCDYKGFYGQYFRFFLVVGELCLSDSGKS